MNVNVHDVNSYLQTTGQKAVSASKNTGPNGFIQEHFYGSRSKSHVRSWQEAPCPPGTFGPETDANATRQCLPRRLMAGPMRILILNADYQSFLRHHYDAHPALQTASYAAQMQARNESLFAVADFYSRNFRRHGHEAWEIHVNNRHLQYAWAVENGFAIEAPDKTVESPRRSRLSRAIEPITPLLRPLVRRLRPFRLPEWEAWVLDAQIKHFQPDVILNQSMEYVRAVALVQHKRPGRLIVGQIAAPRPEGEDYSVYNMVISSLPNFVEWFRARGVRAELNLLAFEADLLEKLGPKPSRDIDLSFVGSLSPEHAGRVQWLEKIARAIPLQIWGNGIERLPQSSPLHACYRGPAWGRGVYEVLRRSRITLNYHIGIAGGWANNMRLYEATGSGALLLNDAKPNLNSMFAVGKEVVTYASPEECVAKIRHYLDHEDERAALAAAGQQRTLADHNYFKRTGEILALIAAISAKAVDVTR